MLAGPATDDLEVVAQFPRAGFETPMPLPAPAKDIAVQALGVGGRVIATSATEPAG